MSTNQPDPKPDPTITHDPEVEGHNRLHGAPTEQPEAEAHGAEASSDDDGETEAHRMRG